MPKWRVVVSYWCGFTGDRDWQDRARGTLEAQGWADIADYVPFSSNVDADEIDFVAVAERPDRETVEKVLKQIGIQHTAYVTIRECETE